MTLPSTLTDQIDRAGYFPDTARSLIERAVGGQEITAFFVHPATAFDGPQVRRHLTVLVLTPRHLHVAHIDDEPADQMNPTQVITSCERIRLDRIQHLGVSQVFATDDGHVSAEQSEVTIGISWGATRRLDLERAWCEDPHCEADHGYTGTSGPADLALRVSALADGQEAVQAALAFYGELTDATA